MKTLKPNYIVGFLKMFACIFCLIILFSGALPHLRDQPVIWSAVFRMAIIGSAFLGVTACAMFTPRSISWDEDRIQLRVNFPKSGEYRWEQLEAYSIWPGRFGTFLLKLEGMQSYQIVPVCFSPKEWKTFHSFLLTRFPDKKTWFWLGPLPMRLGKK